MISVKEIIGDLDIKTLPQEHQDNLKALLEKMNRVRFLYGKPMTVTSGYRSMAHHLEIYAKKGITDKSKIPLKSKHLFGEAADIYDPKKELQRWCVEHESELVAIGLWCEDFSATKNWVHFQIVPPKSGKRFFMP